MRFLSQFAMFALLSWAPHVFSSGCEYDETASLGSPVMSDDYSEVTWPQASYSESDWLENSCNSSLYTYYKLSLFKDGARTIYTQICNDTSYTLPSLSDGTYRIELEFTARYQGENGEYVCVDSNTEYTTFEVSDGEVGSVGSYRGTAELSSKQYDVYIGELDGSSDAVNDIYLSARDKFILLHDDIITPIQVESEPSLVFYGLNTTYGDGISEYPDQVDPQYTAEEISELGLTQLDEGSDYWWGDFDGDGYPDLMLLLTVSGGHSEPRLAVVSGGYDGTNIFAVDTELPDTLQTSPYNVLNGSASLKVADLDGDGRDELYAVTGGVEAHIYYDLSFAAEGTLGYGENYFLETEAVISPSHVGSTPAEFRVSEVGAATYNIPISLPQGRAGLTPSVSLSYSSQAGNGLMGLGWSLSTEPSIKRCRKTLYDDGEAAPISLGADDRFCLGGQKLVLLDSNKEYGDPDTQYKTLIDSYQFIEANGGTDGEANPDYFKVVSKDGLVRYYGSFENAHVTAGSKTLEWRLSGISDTSQNNWIMYDYEGSGGDHRLTAIRYAFLGSYTESYSKVTFSYSERLDPIIGYVGGEEFVQTRRLSRISVYNNSTALLADDPASSDLVRTYRINYLGATAEDSTSRISSIQECAELNGSCLPALEFDWEVNSIDISRSIGATYDIRSTSSAAIQLCYFNNGDPSCLDNWLGHPTYLKELKPGDVDGDGCSDLIYSSINSEGAYFYIVVVMSNSDCSGFSSTPIVLGKTIYGYSGDDAIFQLIDFNADGRSDIAVKNESGTESWDIWLSAPDANGTWTLGNVATTSEYFDANGFGAYLEADMMVDIDSDGLVDLVKFDDNRVQVSYLRRNLSEDDSSSTPYAFTQPVSISGELQTPDAHTCANGSVLQSVIRENERVNGGFVGDFDGDGRSDFLTLGMTTTTCDVNGYPEYTRDYELNVYAISDGELKLIHTVEYDHEQNWESRNYFDGVDPDVVVADFNSDGFTDMIYRKDDESTLLVGNGLTFEAGKTVNMDTSSDSSPQIVDYDHDGYMDIVLQDDNDLILHTWEHAANDFAAGQNLSIVFLADDATWFTDFDGNGVADQIILEDAFDPTTFTKTFNVYFDELGHERSHNVINGFDNGFGAQTHIYYERTNRSDHYLGLDIAGGDTHSCESFHEGRFSCYSPTTQDEFYEELNNPWDLDSEHAEYGRPAFDYRQPINIVTRVESTSPTGDNRADDNLAALEYYYEHARLQAGGRGFLGFRHLTVIDMNVAPATRTRYGQVFPFIGSPEYTWTLFSPEVLVSLSGNFYADNAPSGSGYYQPYVSRTFDLTTLLNSSFESSGVSMTAVEKEIDAHGNPTWMETEVVSWGVDAFSQITEVTNIYGNAGDVVNVYSDNLTYAELGRLTSTTVTKTRDGGEPISKTSMFTYHNSNSSTTVNGYDVRAMHGLLASEAIEPEDNGHEQSQRLTTVYYYDQSGNQTYVGTTGWDGIDTVDRYSYTSYDATGRYVDYVSNTLGQVLETVTERDSLTGIPTTVETAQGVITETEVDELGRPVGTTLNTGSNVNSSIQFLACAEIGTPACPTEGQFAKKSASSDGSQSIEYFDALGRTVRTASLNFHGKWVIVDTLYDVRGRVASVSEPYEYASGAVASLWTNTVYDALGRPSSIVLPDQSVTTIEYEGRKTTTTNALLQTKSEWKNAFGDVVKVEDHLGTIVAYEYDADDNLEVIRVQPEGDETSELVTTLTYDHLGRKVSMDDPDKGYWEYEYNAFGELIRQVDAKGQVVVNEYDLLGRVVKRIDYTNESETAAALEGVTYNYYDGAAPGSPTTRENAYGQVSAVVGSTSLTDNSCNDSASYCKVILFDEYGRPQTTLDAIDADMDPATAREYFLASQTYDEIYGRLETTTDALGFTVNDRNGESIDSGTRDVYNEYGFLEYVEDIATGDEIYRTVSVNARGQVTNAYQGSVGLYYEHDPVTGRLSKQVAYVGAFVDAPGAFNKQYITYEWDVLGNLISRHNQNAETGTDASAADLLSGNSTADIQESFCYDSLNRLTKTNVGTTSISVCDSLDEGSQDQRYDAFGNITHKIDASGALSTYQYGQIDMGSYTPSTMNQAGPRAVSYGMGHYYVYDHNGNMVEDSSGRNITYSTYDKPLEISKGDHTAYFAYGADRLRYLQREVNSADSSKNKTTLYLGNVERIHRPDEGTYEWRRLVQGGVRSYLTDESFTLMLDVDDEDDADVTYILKDHLGSTDVVMDADGNVLQNMSFDAWGARRHVNNLSNVDAAGLLAFNSGYTSRGYTDHEMLDEFGIIHMNGRIYDAQLGRFLQADPFVQAALDTQSYNRYAYVRNNPLNATDPSGYFAETMFFIAFASYVIGRAGEQMGVPELQMIGSMIGCFAGPAMCAVSAFGATYGYTGDISSAIVSGAFAFVSAQAFSGIGELFGASGAAQYSFAGEYGFLHVVAHGAVGGIMSDAQGGNFAKGFASAGISKMATPAIANVSGLEIGGVSVAQAIMAAMVGGTASQISGGKFANGAMTAALGNIFNEQAAHKGRTDQEKISSDIEKIQNKFDETVQEMNDQGLRYSGSPTKGNNSGRINNILSSTVCPNYMGCGEQALHLLEALNTSEFNGSLETPWFKELTYEWGTWEHITPHQYLILTPALDTSIEFKLDPWANTTEIRHE